MSGVFSDYKIAILNEWSKQWSQYQHSWKSEVTYFLKSRISYEWSKQWSQYQHSWQSEVTHILKSRILNELEDYKHK